MKNVVGSIGLCMALCFGASSSVAQVIGGEGQFALGAERLSGVVRASDTVEDSDTDATSTTSFTSVNLLMARSSAASTYSFPRVGLDYFVAEGVSIGGALGMFTLSGSQEEEFMGMSEEQDLNSILGFLLAPRVGYAYAFNETVAIWPRAGITFLTASSDDEDSDATGSMNRLALSLDVPFVFSPAPHRGYPAGSRHRFRCHGLELVGVGRDGGFGGRDLHRLRDSRRAGRVLLSARSSLIARPGRRDESRLRFHVPERGVGLRVFVTSL